MPISLIPWQFFNNALHQQNSQTLQTWLVGWAFTNGGVALVHEREKHEPPPRNDSIPQPFRNQRGRYDDS